MKKLIVLLALVMFATSAMAQTILGVWYDNLAKQKLMLIRSGTDYYMQSKFTSGNIRTENLVKVVTPRGVAYAISGSDAGEFYMIDSNNNLGLWDEQGLIDTIRQ